jgi:hypothetical protein
MPKGGGVWGCPVGWGRPAAKPHGGPILGHPGASYWPAKMRRILGHGHCPGPPAHCHPAPGRPAPAPASPSRASIRASRPRKIQRTSFFRTATNAFPPERAFRTSHPIWAGLKLISKPRARLFSIQKLDPFQVPCMSGTPRSTIPVSIVVQCTIGSRLRNVFRSPPSVLIDAQSCGIRGGSADIAYAAPPCSPPSSCAAPVSQIHTPDKDAWLRPSRELDPSAFCYEPKIVCRYASPQ